MQFICPHCGAIYRIDDETRLAASDGLVSCFRCKRVFLVEEITVPLKNASPPVARELPPKIKRSRESLRAKPASASSAPGHEPPEPITQQPFSLRPATDEKELERRLVEAKAENRPPRRLATFVWGLGALILLLSAAGQVLWYSRSSPQAHAVLSILCSKLDCDLEPLREPAAFRISERVFLRDPDHPDLLSLQMRISNDAPFSQSYPGIELVLYDNTQTVIAKSRIAAEEYLGQKGASVLLESGASGTIKLYIPDPGPDATGFAIEFF